MRTLSLALVLCMLSSAVHGQWHQLPAPPAGGPYSFAEIPNSEFIYASTDDGVWVTTDHMQTWTRAGLERHFVGRLFPCYSNTHGLILFAYADTAIYRTQDSGATWMAVFHG